MLATTNVLARNRINDYSLLDEVIEQLATRTGRSSIKSKHKFVQIVIQMRRTWCTLMCSQQPSFQQGGNTIGQRQQIFTNISRLTNHFMMITNRFQLRKKGNLISLYSLSSFSGISFQIRQKRRGQYVSKKAIKI